MTTRDSNSPGSKDLRIILVGKTGNGKSSTGNTILGRTAFKAKFSSSSVTKTCRKDICYHEDRPVSIIDTPGIFDTSMTEEDFKKEIERCIMLSVPGPHVFLLVIRLDARFTKEEKNTVKWIKDNFGAEASKYTMVLFTRGDMIKEPIETFLDDNAELREVIRSCNARFIVFDNTTMLNRTQVNDLFEKIDEIVQLNGSHYTSSMYEEAQKKIKDAEWRRRWGNHALTVGTGLMAAAALNTGAAAVAAGAAENAAGAAVVAEEIALSVGQYLWAGVAGGVCHAIGKFMKPRTEDV